MPAQERDASKPGRLHLSMRSAIIGAALCFGLLLAAPLTWFNYHRSSQAALTVAADLVRLAGDKVAQHIGLLAQPVNFLTDHIQFLPGADAAPQGFSHPLLGAFLDLMADSPQIYSIYFGYGDGDFFQAISLGANPKVAASLKAPAQARFALRSIRQHRGGPLERWRFLDAEKQVLAEQPPVPAGYDPRSRPWFTAAAQMDGPSMTRPYVFSSTQELGLTVSRRIHSARPIVFGLDLTLESLSKFLAAEAIGPSGLLFLFDAQGRVIGHPNAAKLSLPSPTGAPRRAQVENLDDPRSLAVFRLFQERGSAALPLQHLRMEGEDYLVQVRPVAELGSGQNFLALVAKVDDFTGPLAKTRDQSLLFALALVLVAVPGLALLAGRFSNALGRLAREADQIRSLQLDSKLCLGSRIDEMDRLGGAVVSMRSALSSFSRYLPRTLVKQFIDSGVDPVLGGEPREITLLFTDVENFTPLAENLAPEDLMAAMGEYFQLVGKAILDSGGTIDKFIGDAVMAFWNAPFEAENHVELACLAALRLSKVSEELNARRLAAGLPLLRTRVGLHAGAAVVGNVGSADRMDYTALGANVNLASRLEGLNKFYGTSIMASRAVRERAKKQFLFRSVDVVVPKGASAPMAVFELVGAMPASPYAEVAAPRASLGFCSRWERAVTLYRTVQWDKALAEFSGLLELHPADRLAAMYCTRARRLLDNKPGKDWKAVERFKDK